MSNLAKRLWIYQKERFPLGILTVTTAAVLASTFAVLEWHGSAFVGWMPSKDQKSSCNCARMAHWPSSPGSSVRKPALLATNAPAASDEKL